MTEFEKVLEECLDDLERGASSLDECLSRYPQHALQLGPILLTAAYLQYGREARPSAAFKARVRAKLTQGMQAHPRKSMPFSFMLMRPAMTLAVIVLAMLVTGTAYAQSALPGDAFYTWKLASENAWRAVSPDPVGTDLALADRRVDELIAVADNPALYSQTLGAYLEVVNRLKSEMDAENEARILQTLDSQIEELNSSGIRVPGLDQDVLPGFDEPSPTPIATPLFVPEIPRVDPTSPIPTTSPLFVTNIPPVDPTDLPEVIPTIQVSPKIIPTIEIPPPVP